MNRAFMYVAALVAVGLVGGAGYFLGRSGQAPPSPVEAAEQTKTEADELTLSSEQFQAAGIELARAERVKLNSRITVPGSVFSMPGAQAVLTARADGSVVRVFKGLGDPVRAGETLALIESRDASAITAEVEAASAKADLARAEYQRQKRLHDAGAASLQTLEVAQTELTADEAELRRAEASARAAGVSKDGRTIAVSSPTSGRISATSAALGEFVTAGTELYRVVDPTRVEIRASVPAGDTELVLVGSETKVEMLGGEMLTALVKAITPDANPSSRSATVVLTPGSGGEHLRPGQAVRVTLPLPDSSGEKSTALTLPSEAVQMLDGRDVVFVRTPEGFKVQPVTVGARNDDRVEIAEGLGPDQEVAGRNAFLLKAELSKGEEETGE